MTRFTSPLKSRIGLIQFLGSNCDRDCFETLREHFGVDVMAIWHTEKTLPRVDGLILPGGFSYGDYLRSGALAAHAPIMEAVQGFTRRGGAVIGICNGFQILTEASLLPGVLLKNHSRKFICDRTILKIANGDSSYHQSLRGKTYQIPIAHGEGAYYDKEDSIKKLSDSGQILFSYESNPNGSLLGIAGIISENKRVVGMMPHPERAMDPLLGGSCDGIAIWEAFFATFL